MKGNGPLDRDNGEVFCLKRLWVLTALSNDELLDHGDALPQGLRFHLARCESCRELADRMMSVTGSLRELSELEAEDDLADRADAQAFDALRAGAKLTGRVTIPDELEVEVIRPGRASWLRFGRVAAAAAIVSSVAFVGIQRLSQPARQVLVEDRLDQPGESAPHTWDPLPVGPEGLPRTGDVGRVAVGGSEDDAPTASSPYSIPRYDTHYEAALANDPGSVQAAFPRPRRRVGTAHRTAALPTTRWAVPALPWRAVFDRPAPIESTSPSPNER